MLILFSSILFASSLSRLVTKPVCASLPFTTSVYVTSIHSIATRIFGHVSLSIQRQPLLNDASGGQTSNLETSLASFGTDRCISPE